LLRGISPMRAGFFAILSLVGLSMIRKETRMSPRVIFEALRDGALNALIVGAACAAAGIIMAIVSMTGLGAKLAAAIASLSGGQMLPALLLTMITSIILGMGMVAVSAYLILAALVAPALIRMGVTPIVAHLFTYYFGMVSNVTPPVAVGAFVAAGIAEADQMKTAIAATKLSIVAFIIPFMFVYDPRIMLIGPARTLIMPALTAAVGVIALASSLHGRALVPATLAERAALFLGSLFMISGSPKTDAIGFIIFLVSMVSQYVRWQKTRQRRHLRNPHTSR